MENMNFHLSDAMKEEMDKMTEKSSLNEMIEITENNLRTEHKDLKITIDKVEDFYRLIFINNEYTTYTKYYSLHNLKLMLLTMMHINKDNTLNKTSTQFSSFLSMVSTLKEKYKLPYIEIEKIFVTQIELTYNTLMKAGVTNE